MIYSVYSIYYIYTICYIYIYNIYSPGKDETRVCGYIRSEFYSLSTLENTDENRIFFVCSPHHKHFGKAQHLVL